MWIVFSLWTGLTFVGFFTPIRELTPSLLQGQAGGWELFWVLGYGFATYGNAGWMREQFCQYICPYARFQSAMLDRDSMVIAYDTKRGEPRRNSAESAIGDCINCQVCVQVCPTGIDIRDGLQYECIGCAACIDACDAIMTKVDKPIGLIRYTTENQLDGKPRRILRPRVYLYSVLLLIVTTVFITWMVSRAPVSVDISRDRNALFRSDGINTENAYVLHITNQSKNTQAFYFEANGIDGLHITPKASPVLPPNDRHTVTLTLTASNDALTSRITPVTIEIKNANGEMLNSVETRFMQAQP